MIATIWRFHVPTMSVEAFKQAYGPTGDCTDLFARAPRYVDTELLELDGEDSVYPTIDRWNTQAEFHAAKKMLEREHAALDRRCDAYTSGEAWLNLYTICE